MVVFLRLFHFSSSFLERGFVNPTNLKFKIIASDFCFKFTPKSIYKVMYMIFFQVISLQNAHDDNNK
jgi:hypothetical protein